MGTWKSKKLCVAWTTRNWRSSVYRFRAQATGKDRRISLERWALRVQPMFDVKEQRDGVYGGLLKLYP
jgi:hypothetical protein